ncbi:hypothetical protein GCM10027596_03800 [Nocardioides korecus]
MPPPWGRALPDNRWDLVDAETAPARTVSVVVTHFEQPAQLARTLAALARQTSAPDEVVVVDDGSREAPRVPPGVTLLRQEDLGFRAAAARHLGASHAGGDVLVFLDADTTPEPDFVEALTRLPRLAPDLLAVGRRRHADLAGTDPDVAVEEAGPAHELPEPAWLRDAYARSRDLLDADDLSCRFVISAVMACSRWWYEQVGGFDTDFSAYGGEDWELAHRSRVAGGLVAHVAGAVAWHDGPDAGAAPRGVKTRESVAVAGRIGVPGLAPQGLLGLGGRRVPVDRLLALPDDLDEGTLLLLADAALHADPGAHLLLGSAHADVLAGDPRVVTRGDGPALDAALASPARVLVELHRPWLLDPPAWRALLRAVPPGGDGVVTHLDGTDPVATSTALRLVRRARRWGEPDPTPVAVDLPGEPLPPSLTPESWWGGWGPGAPQA